MPEVELKATTSQRCGVGKKPEAGWFDRYSDRWHRDSETVAARVILCLWRHGRLMPAR